MRKIAVITGTRAEYGYLKPLMKAIEKDRELDLIPIATGMHLLSDFGNTYKFVENDFPNIIKIPMRLDGDSLKDMAFYLSSGIKNFSGYLYENPPDILVVLGDRTESLAVALAGLYLNIPIAHINGGDVTGTTIDESIRHAITKIAHIHLVHTSSNAVRIKKMGEDEKRIFITGALTLDTILNTKLMPKDEILYSQLEELFMALDTLKEQTILLYPNCDAGGKKFIEIIERYTEKEYICAFKNLPHEDYLSLMKSVDIMIGNSSSGIIEAPSFKLPVINIGNRQQGRERSENIIDVKPRKEEILEAVDFAFNNKDFLSRVKRCKNKFGDGKAAQKIVKIFKDIKIDDRFIQKQITY